MQVMRGAKRKGVRYFGPYSHAWAIRETVDLLLRVFPVRTCSAGVFKRAGQIGRPCLLGYIGKCSAPCVGRVSAAGAPRAGRGLLRLHGRAAPARFIRRIEADMRAGRGGRGVRAGGPAARRHPRPCERALEKQAVVLGDGTDCDVIALCRGPARGGRAGLLRARRPGPRPARLGRGQGRGRRPPAELVEQLPASSTATVATSDTAGAGSGVPREVLVPELPPDADAVTELAGRAARRPGSACGCRSAATSGRCWRPWPATPRQSLTLHKTRRASDLTTRSQALEEIQEALGAGRRAAADRVLRRLQPAGHRTSSRRWWCSRTAWPARASTAGSASRGRDGRTTSLHPRGDHPPVPPLPAEEREETGELGVLGDPEAPSRPRPGGPAS